MQVSATIILLAIVVEQVTNIIKGALPAVRDEWTKLSAIVIGIALSISTRTGVLSELNVAIAYPIVDYVITGLLISRGSNVLHDMFESLNQIAQARKMPKVK